VADPLAHRFIPELRTRYGDATADSPALDTPITRAGEIVFTPGQKIALLKMRGSDWSKAVLRHLIAFGHIDAVGADYFALARIGLAARRGSYHVLTPQGRWRADRVAVELARKSGIHVITFNLNPRYGAAANAKCTCGWSSFRTRAVPSYALLVDKDAQHHLEHEGALP
jgi:hypothetical protein